MKITLFLVAKYFHDPYNLILEPPNQYRFAPIKSPFYLPTIWAANNVASFNFSPTQLLF